MANPPESLQASALGTKEYWDNVYQRELANHADDSDDEGTVWFDDAGAEDRMLGYLAWLRFGASKDEPGDDENAQNVDLRVLDLGTGNGHMLFELKDMGWRAHMVGVDYSETSIALARQIQQARAARDPEAAEASSPVDFYVADILAAESPPWAQDGFDLVLDKGTFDAISLSSDRNIAGQTGPETYCSNVVRLMRPGGYFLITSCNWIEEELRRWLDHPQLKFTTALTYPSFSYGGVTGQTVHSLCFQKR